MASSESCCEQCSQPVPLLCWRYKVKYNLEQGRIVPATPDCEESNAQLLDANDVKDQNVLKQLKKPTSTTDPYQKFNILDVWRDDLLTFFEQESGNFNSADRQWISNYYDWEAYQAKLALNEKLKGTDK